MKNGAAAALSERVAAIARRHCGQVRIERLDGVQTPIAISTPSEPAAVFAAQRDGSYLVTPDVAFMLVSVRPERFRIVDMEPTST